MLVLQTIEGIVESSPIPLDQFPSVATIVVILLYYMHDRSHDKAQDDKIETISNQISNALMKVNAIETAVKCVFSCLVADNDKNEVAKIAVQEIDRINPGTCDTVLTKVVKDWAKSVLGERT